MEVVSGSGKWKYCEVVVDGPNEPLYISNSGGTIITKAHYHNSHTHILFGMRVAWVIGSMCTGF